MRSMRILSLLFAVAIAGSACNKQDEKASMTVKMTDSPGDYVALEVTVSQIEMQSENNGWVVVSDEKRTFNVLSLTNGAELNLVSNSEIEAGNYTKIRVTFDEKTMLTVNADADLDGIKLNTQNQVALQWEGPKEVEIALDLKVKSMAQSEILLDFDVANSIKQRVGSMVIQPTIKYVQDAETGVRGQVSGTANAAIIVSAGDISHSSYTDAAGSFLVRGMKGGVYKVTVIPERESKMVPAPEPYVIENVTVVEGEFKQVGTISF